MTKRGRRSPQRTPNPGADRAGAPRLARRSPAMADHSEGMAYLDTLPKRIVTVYIPLVLIMVVLLFPFYWMVLTAIKPDEQLLDLETVQPLLRHRADLQAHLQAPVRDRLSALALEHDVHLGRRDRAVAVRERARRLCHHPHPLSRRELRRRRDLPRLSRAALDPVHPALDGDLPYGLFDSVVRADPRLPDDPDPVLDLAAHGVLQDHPLRARGMRPHRRREPLADPDQDHRCRWRSPA